MKVITFVLNILRITAFIIFIISCGKDPRIGPQGPIKLELISIPDLQVQINSPADSSFVPRLNIVKGTISGIPPGYVLRVFVHPILQEGWYPQHPVTVRYDGTWSATSYIGREDAIGEQFEIGAMVVNEQQRKEIDKDLSGNTSFIISGPIPATISVTRL